MNNLLHLVKSATKVSSEDSEFSILLTSSKMRFSNLLATGAFLGFPPKFPPTTDFGRKGYFKRCFWSSEP